MARAAMYLGADVGSTATKVCAFDGDGNPLAWGTADYPISRPEPGFAEQDATQWWAALQTAIDMVDAEVSLGEVQALGVVSQVDTHTLLDADLEPPMPAMLWQDVRAGPHAEALNEQLGTAGLLEVWGAPDPIDASNPVPRAIWLAEHRAEVWNRSRWLLLPKDYINAQLTGVVASDPLSSFKVVGADGAYLRSAVALAPGLDRRLAPLRPPEDRVGELRATLSSVRPGIPVATATMDAFGNLLGSGLTASGDTMVILGTSAIVGMVGVGGTAGSGVVNFSPYRGRQVHAGPTQSGGDSVRWWAQLTGRAVSEVFAAAATAQPGSGGVVFAPHLLGERAPLWDSAVRGWFIGLDASTGFAEASRAVLEGVAFSVRELLEAIEVAGGTSAGRIILSGGGSRDGTWCQILGDILGRAVQRSRSVDTAVVGAATLAASCLTGDDPWEAGARLASTDSSFQPRPRSQRIYGPLYDAYRSSYEGLRRTNQELHEARSGGTDLPLA
ncbi:FGGY-family carbohydrate kinase [soil metagenome]